ncbi:LysR family transcriptional regulator [Asticcacaulis sp. DW145]|uniref:LysR substrate-binding domain-containing protein n=1 Tax=Asticcacaulis currens TaxID=2984210 RepID=A0ABT5IB89_9CAUL|nr:LysR substrate-binding domain-containing protein [Asticcacaulis currens]MDC7693444.1 LysR substrate-binding domain-containing protein [Asticcacaulis currens]BEV10511.1 LysR family transcriptional regulator [Asticcacaulis sp. DW145]
MPVSPDDSAERSRRRETGSLSIGALKAFVTVVDQGSFSRAAAALGVSQPNISNQINTLEQICGVRLLNRRTQNQNLTDAGRELYTRARLVISRVDDFEMTANLFSGLKRGRMSVGFSTPPAAMQLISQFIRTYPDIEITSRLGNTRSLTLDVMECRADVAIISLLEPDPVLACHLVFEQSLNLMVPVDHPFAQRSHIEARELSGLPLILREEGSVTRALTEIALGRSATSVERGFIVESREAVKEATAHGIGFGCILDGEIGHDARLKALPVQGMPRTGGVYIVTLRENMEIPAVSAFIRLAGLRGNGL